MALTLRNFGKGSLGTTVGTICSAISSTKSALIESVIFVNKNGSSTTVNVYVTRSGVDTLVLTQSIAATSRFVWTTPISLNGNDSLRGSASATNVDYLISGAEKDL